MSVLDRTDSPAFNSSIPVNEGMAVLDRSKTFALTARSHQVASYHSIPQYPL